MATARYVVLGLAHARAPWFGAVARWAHAAAVPVDFVKCLSAEEVRARLRSGRRFSALLCDGGLPALDRDLLATSAAAGCAVVVVDDGRVARDWPALGAAASLPPSFSPAELVEVLGRHARVVGRADAVPAPGPLDVHAAPAALRGRLVAVCGPGGTGASTAAIAVAQGFAEARRHGPLVLLADLARHAEQAMLHDARDLGPGVQELVDAHRAGRPGLDDVRALTHAVGERGYHLLLGLRRSRFWATLRPHAVDAALETLQRAYHVVVCDVDADLEGEDDAGSIDVEERNAMARAAVRRADAVVAVGSPSCKGVHSLVRVLADLTAAGVPPERIVPVLNRAPRSRRRRAALAGAVAALWRPAPDAAVLAGPVFCPERHDLDDTFRDGTPVPAALARPVTAACTAVFERCGRRVIPDAGPLPVPTGTVGTWTGSGEAAG